VARGLCATHYQAARRHRILPEFTRWYTGQGQQKGDRNHDSYDERFTSLFLHELQVRNSPRYPDNRWFAALNQADVMFRRLQALDPVLFSAQVPEEGMPPMGYATDRNLRIVGFACTEWLRRRGLIHTSRICQSVPTANQ
jgi:hypothetical protein